jgi:hypothetical protein
MKGILLKFEQILAKCRQDVRAITLCHFYDSYNGALSKPSRVCLALAVSRGDSVLAWRCLAYKGWVASY